MIHKITKCDLFFYSSIALGMGIAWANSCNVIIGLLIGGGISGLMLALFVALNELL